MSCCYNKDLDPGLDIDSAEGSECCAQPRCTHAYITNKHQSSASYTRNETSYTY